MIAKLAGIVDSTGDNHAVIDVGGVGYLVFASRAHARPPAARAAARCGLLIETHVREDHIHLYGFADAGERDWFRLLTTVQGVGAKVALAVLSVLTPDELVHAIAAQDRLPIARANGVGPKLAAAHRDRAQGQGRRHRARARRGQRQWRARRAFLGRGRCCGRRGLGAGQSRLSPRRGVRRGRAGARNRLGADAPLEALIKAGLKELSA